MDTLFTINPKIFDISITKDKELNYAKSFMHMLNEFALKKGAIDEVLFKQTEIEIEKIDKA